MRSRTSAVLSRVLLAAALLPGLTTAAHALDYRSVGEPRIVLYDAPSAKGKKLFIATQYYPVEVIVDLGEWVKVRDKSGGLAWVESRQLASRRTVVALERIDVREAADAASPVVFRVERDVALELVEAGKSGWAKVRHADGATGYILANQVWGL